MSLPGSTNSEEATALSTLRFSTHANGYLSDFKDDQLRSAKSYLFDTSSWGPFCDART
jgi:hypothetical protein